MGNGVHYLDGLIASVSRSDISSHRYPAWKLERLLLLWTWQPRSHELLDESGYPHPEASQLGMHAVRNHDGSFQLAPGDPGYQALVFVGAYGGLRIGELAGLRRSRVDLDAGTVDVAETVVEVEGRLLFGPPKTRAGRRRIGLPRRVVDELALHLRAPGRPTDPVFRSPAGGPLRVTAFRNRIWRPATLAAGLPGLRIHDLRHTAVTLWIAAGPPPRRSRSGPGTPRPASCWTATATCSPSPMRRCATAWTNCLCP